MWNLNPDFHIQFRFEGERNPLFPQCKSTWHIQSVCTGSNLSVNQYDTNIEWNIQTLDDFHTSTFGNTPDGNTLHVFSFFKVTTQKCDESWHSWTKYFINLIYDHFSKKYTYLLCVLSLNLMGHNAFFGCGHWSLESWLYLPLLIDLWIMSLTPQIS